MTFTAWAPGEPNDCYGLSPEDYARAGIDGLWSDQGVLTDCIGSPPDSVVLIELISDDCDNDGLPDAFEVATGGSAPACATVSPSGTFSFAPLALTITGPGLSAVTAVKFGGVAAPIVSQSASTIVAQPAPSEPGYKAVKKPSK